MNNKKLYTLSNAQKLLRLSENFTLNPHMAKENHILSFYIKTPLYPELYAKEIGTALENSLNEVIKNNDSLRLHVIKTKDGIRQYINDFEPLTVERVPLEGEKAFEELLSHIDRYTVDWFGERLLWAKIYQMNDHQCVLLLRIHHAVFDGYSIKLFFEQFIAAYQAFIAGKEPDSASFKTGSIVRYFEENEKYLHSAQYQADKKYWCDKLGHQRHYSFPAGQSHPIGDSDRLSTVFDGELYENLSSLSHECGCSLQSMLMTIAAITVCFLTGKDNFCISSLSHGRRKYPLKNCIGCMVTSIPILYDFDDPEKTIRRIIEDCYAVFLEALQHGQFPEGDKLSAFKKESIKHFFNFVHGWLLFSSMDYESVKSQSELEIVDLPSPNQPNQFYLSVLDTHRGSVTLVLSYQTHKFKAEKVREILNTYEAVCKAVSENAEISLRELFDMLREKNSG